MNFLKQLEETVQFINSKIDITPKIGMILGSGLGSLADEIENPIHIDYKSIPHFPVSTVEGHAGKLVLGNLEGKQVVAMQGRFHYYEGYSMQQVTFPVRVMKALGVEIIIVTNACGGLNSSFEAGGLMFIEDHLNMTGDNPLIGQNFNELGPRFPDMGLAYDLELIALGKGIAKNQNIKVFQGVHAAVSGPYYLSKAELRMIRTCGADTIGMSTVPEVIVAVHAGMKVLGISCITDMADPESEIEPLNHETVMRMAARIKPTFIKLVKGILKVMN